MQATTTFHTNADARALPLPAAGTQFLPVSGYITERYLVSYRADAARLSVLVPRPFSLDTYGGYGFVSICAVQIRDMGIVGSPRFLRFDNQEFLYRLAVRFRSEPTFVTLRSDVTSRVLAVLGRHFSHYRPRLAQIERLQSGSWLRVQCATRDGSGDAIFEVDRSSHGVAQTSVFPDQEKAAAFLLGMAFSADAVGDRVRVQRIDHEPWQPRFVKARTTSFGFIRELGCRIGAAFDYDSTLACANVWQTWRAARWS
jgi:hypothetical protein